jgi:putative spermidine/putrescine transport system permease protein
VSAPPLRTGLADNARPIRVSRYRRRYRNWPPSRGAWLFLPAAALLISIYLIPLLLIVRYSFTGAASTWQNYVNIASSSLYLTVLATTLKIALYSSVVSLLLAYPYAYLMSRSRGFIAALLGLISVFPYLTSTVVRSFSFVAILANDGPVPALLRHIGFVNPPTLLGNTFSVTIGIVQTQLPFVVLPIYIALVSVRREYVDAAASLGASGLKTFWRIVFPLSKQGVIIGFLLAFIYALGAYVTPQLLGGRGTLLIGPAITEQVQILFGFGVASTMGVLLIVISAVMIAAAVRVTGARSMVSL